MLRTRPGFTLAEVILATTLSMIVFALTIPFFRSQAMVLAHGAGQLDVLQSTSFAVDRMDQDLRAAGTNLATRQPVMVQARTDAVTFNGDLNDRLGTALGAIYYDEDVDSATSSAMLYADRLQLPNAASASWTYPRTDYGGYAETIAYWLRADTVSSRAGEYMLMRRVNAAPARLVARAIVIPAGDQVFRYFKSDTVNGLREIPAASLPIWHDSATHGDSLRENSAMSKRIDSIRVVRVRLTGIFRDARRGDVRRTIERTIRLGNAGTAKIAACGDAPAAPTNVTAATVDDGVPDLTLTWDPSADEPGGDHDVELYAVFRRLSGASAFPNEPIATVPAGSSSYSFADPDVVLDERYVYGVTATDCGRQVSSPGTSSTIRIR